MNCDVLVIGASPSGIMAAIYAAKEGAEVFLLDKDMGEHFNHPANTFFQGMFSRTGQRLEREYVLHELEGMHIISPGSHCLQITAPGYFIDRSKFDQMYIKRAEQAGVELLKGRALSSNLADMGRRVKTDLGTIDAKVVIDAEGVESTLAKKSHISSLKHPQDVAWALEAVVYLPGLGEEKFFEYWIGSMAPGWKATFSPGGGDRATLGVFVRRRGQNLQTFLNEFIKRFKKYKLSHYKNIGDLKIISQNHGGDPIATLPHQIVSDSLMVVGAAAGQSGMMYGMRAGEICGSVAAQAVQSGNVSKNNLSKYEQQWKREFYWEYRLGRASLETLRLMSDEDIDSLTKGLIGKDLNFEGSLVRKSTSAISVLGPVLPKLVPNLVRRLIEG